MVEFGKNIQTFSMADCAYSIYSIRQIRGA